MQISITMNSIAASNAAIRNFEPSDTHRIREIAWETSFTGAMAERTRIDENLVADLLTLYYTDFEPESIFVAELNGRVEGYIMGSINPGKFKRKTAHIFLARILPKLILGRYKKILKALPLLMAIITGVMKGEHDPETESDYPAHLHINIGRNYQRSGIGSQLMSAWLQYLNRKNVKGVSLSTLSTNKKAILFFKKWGFEPFFRYRSTFWSFVSGKTVSVEILVKKLYPDEGRI